MRLRALALALLCALSSAHVRAAEPAQAPTIKWLLPWQQGTALEYASELLTTEDRRGVRKRTRATSETTVRIIEALPDGFVQAWSDKNYAYVVLEGDKAEEADYHALADAMKDVALEVKLDADGNLAGVRNLDAITPVLRTAMRRMLQAGMERGLAKVDAGKRDAARKEASAHIDATLERLLAPPVLQAVLTRNIQNYNGFVGIDLEPDQAYEVKTELPNPTGGPMFPATLTVSLSVSQDDPDDLYVAWDQAIDPEKGAEAALSAGEHIIGQRIPNTGKDAIKSIVVQDEGLFVVHRPTGVVEMFESTRTTEVAGLKKVERQRLRLTNGEHAHTWRDEAQAPVAEPSETQ